MEIYTRRLAGPAFLPTSAAVQLTVPASHTYVIKSVILANNNATAKIVTLSINGSGTSNYVANGISVPGSGNLQLVVLWPLVAGETLYGVTQNASTVAMSLSGFDFDES